MSAPGDWLPLMREALQAEREAGVKRFDDAWANSLRRHPAPNMFLPPIRTTLFLLGDEEDEEESVSEFAYRVFAREWAGGSKASRLLGHDLVERGWAGAFARSSPRRGGAQ